MTAPTLSVPPAIRPVADTSIPDTPTFGTPASGTPASGSSAPEPSVPNLRTPVAAAAAVASIANRVAREAIPARNAVRITALVGPAAERQPAAGAHAVAAAGATRGAGPTLDTLPGRDLDQQELLALAASIAADTAPLEQHIAFSDDRRHYVSLHRDTHVDVWLLCWTPQNDTGWHDHDISSGAVAVLRGALTEHNLAIGTPSIETEIGAGSAFGFGPDHIHRLTGRDVGSVSVHAYSPPLWRMGQYTLGAGGQLRRRSVSYADELRPLDDMA